MHPRNLYYIFALALLSTACDEDQEPGQSSTADSADASSSTTNDGSGTGTTGTTTNDTADTADTTAASEGNADGTCVPNCEGLSCGPDGCGGSCGACDSGECVTGVCICPEGQNLCGVSCVDLNTDVTHCGACGVVCDQPENMDVECKNQACDYDCMSEFRNCDGDLSNGCELSLQKVTYYTGDNIDWQSWAFTPDEDERPYTGAWAQYFEAPFPNYALGIVTVFMATFSEDIPNLTQDIRIHIYDADGPDGAPGTLVHSHTEEVSVESVCRPQAFDLEGEVMAPEGGFYLVAEWDIPTGDGLAICGNNAEVDPAAKGYWRQTFDDDPDAAEWALMTDIEGNDDFKTFVTAVKNKCPAAL